MPDHAKTDPVERESAAIAARQLTPAAQRALAEAEQRRSAQKHEAAAVEVNGRGGLDPARFGDWEIKGLAIDF
jgi:hypothetical protein